jgi:hypothetical protein
MVDHISQMDDQTINHYCEAAVSWMVGFGIIPAIDCGYQDHPRFRDILAVANDLFMEDGAAMMAEARA